MPAASKFRTGFAAAVCLIALLPPATAAMLLGTTGYGGTSSTLVEVDPATGAIIRTIGPVGYGVNGLTYDVTTGKLYGAARYGDPNHNGLIEINMNTGAGTPIGADGWGTGNPEPITNIATNSAGQMFGWTEWGDNLVSINKTTGIPSLVGYSGIGTWSYGLAFDMGDELYLILDGNTYQIDTGTGVASLLGPYNGGTIHHGDFHPANNLYYGLSYTFGDPRQLYFGDVLNDGPMTLIGDVGDLHTLTFVPGDAQIPEPSSLALLGSALTGLYFLRRRR